MPIQVYSNVLRNLRRDGAVDPRNRVRNYYLKANQRDVGCQDFWQQSYLAGDKHFIDKKLHQPQCRYRDGRTQELEGADEESASLDAIKVG
jgi:hypothetical protein